MGRIDVQRVVLGGLLAGFIMNVIDSVANGFLFGAHWVGQAEALQPGLVARVGMMSTWGWLTIDFVLGIVTVWCYAAIRPRFGAGPGTAMRAAIAVWVASHAMFASYVTMGLFGPRLIAASSAAGLVASILGGLAGGWLYRESSADSTAAARAAA